MIDIVAVADGNKYDDDKHISEKVKKAYMMLGIIKRNFIHISRNFFIILYKSLVRSHLEYANNVWYPKRTRSSAIAGTPCDAKACQGLLNWTWK